MQSFPDLRVIAEPGRFYTESAVSLATNVIAKKRVTKHVNNRQVEERKGASLYNF